MFNRKFIILLSGVAALGGLLFGFDTAIISGAIPYISPYFHLDAGGLGWAVGCILIGCAGGALSAGWLAERYGRRFTLIICAVLFAVSGIGAGLAHTLTVFVLFRLTGGLGVGAAAMVSPMYIAETVPAAWRGRLVSLYQLAIVTGILLAYFSNYFFARYNDNWRLMFASQAVPAVLFFGLLLCVPETPRWLARNGRQAAALQLLARISGSDAAQTELEAIQASFLIKSGSSFQLLFSKPYRAVLLTGILIAVFQQVTGINAVLYYAPVIFRETGLDSSSALLQTISIGAVNVLATFIAIGLVDKVGRKRFLLTGSLLMGSSLCALALCFQLHFFDYYLVLIGLVIYVGSFGCTLGAVTWVYLSEIFPNAVRGIALSVATLALWLADFVVTYTFPLLSASLGTPMTLACYALFCALAFGYIFHNVPETKDRSLEEIETLFLPNHQQKI
jgi:SP family arabinose:H+ symporter-like MFS transporter